MEEQLAKIWEEVLRLQHVEPDANFFEIGGDSLKAMEVIVRVREVLQVELPLISFFEDPTVDILRTFCLAGKGVEETLAEDLGRGAAAAARGQGRELLRNRRRFTEGNGSDPRVSEVLHVDLPLIAFFEEPTVLHLAAVLSGGRRRRRRRWRRSGPKCFTLPHVETNANFFDIGGDSLKAMEVIVAGQRSPAS